MILFNTHIQIVDHSVRQLLSTLKNIKFIKTKESKGVVVDVRSLRERQPNAILHRILDGKRPIKNIFRKTEDI